jgi:hypothetical protein
MEVSEVLKKAWSAVEDAGLPSEIHETAFREAVRLLVPETTAPAAPATAPRVVKPAGNGSTGSSGSGSGGSNGDAGINVSEAEIHDKVVAQTGVDRLKLEDVVHLDGGVLKVSIPGIKLGKNNAEKTRVIAQILTIVRGFGLDEAETSVEIVRAEAIRLKCYDSANFSSQLGKLSGFVITGSGTNRRIRSKAAGIQAFPGLVDSLLGES